MEGMAEGTESSAHGTPVGNFSYKNHTDLSSRMTEGYMWILTEEDENENI